MHKRDDLKYLSFGQTVVDHTHAMIAYWDKNLVCRFANASYMEWFGKTKREMINKMTLPELLGPLYQMNLPFITAVLKGERQVFERQIRRPDGQIRNTIATYVPDKAANIVRGFFVHVADISSIKSADKGHIKSQNEIPGFFKTSGLAERVETELRNNILRPFPGISKLARTFFVSESTVKRIFKIKYQQNIFTYFRNLQMTIAENYLTSKQFNKNQLAEMFGFSKPSNFSTCYNTYLKRKKINAQVQLLKQVNDEYYMSFIANLPFAMALLDNHMKYLSASAEWKKLYKMLRGRETGEFCRSFFFADQAKWKSVFKNSLKGQVHNGEEELKDAQKKIRWVRWDVRPWYRDKHISGVMLFIEDITVQKTRDAESRKIFEILETAGGIAKIGTWKRNFNTKTSLWSKVTREILEVPDNYLADPRESLAFYKEGKNRNLVKTVLDNAIKNGQSFDIQAEIITAKKANKTVRIIGHPDFKNGHCERLFGIIQDITNSIAKRNS